MGNLDNATWDTLWKFLRGDTPVGEFERWAYEEPSLETLIGPDVYLRMISTDFRSADQVGQLRTTLTAIARASFPLRCECLTLANTAVVDMGEHEQVFATLQENQVRGQPYWWLSAYSCRVCGQAWLVAQEERQNDIFCMRRLEIAQVERLQLQNEWPTDFDSYETLLRIGLQAGRAVRFADPVGDSSLASTIADLALERPGIRVSELATLLNLSPIIASTIATTVAKETGLRIEFDLDAIGEA